MFQRRVPGTPRGLDRNSRSSGESRAAAPASSSSRVAMAGLYETGTTRTGHASTPMVDSRHDAAFAGGHSAWRSVCCPRRQRAATALRECKRGFTVIAVRRSTGHHSRPWPWGGVATCTAITRLQVVAPLPSRTAPRFARGPCAATCTRRGAARAFAGSGGTTCHAECSMAGRDIPGGALRSVFPVDATGRRR